MFDEQVVYQEVVNILQASVLPLSPGELAGEIWSRVQGRLEGRPSQLYSPRLRYSVGTRLFHPAEKFRQWLTVCEPVADTYFRAVFDDGKERRLAPGDTTTAYPSTLEGPEQHIEAIVMARAQTCPEIVEAAPL